MSIKDAFGKLFRLFDLDEFVLILQVLMNIRDVKDELVDEDPLNPKQFDDTDDMVERVYAKVPVWYKGKATEAELKGFVRSVAGVVKYGTALVS